VDLTPSGVLEFRFGRLGQAPILLIGPGDCRISIRSILFGLNPNLQKGPILDYFSGYPGD